MNSNTPSSHSGGSGPSDDGATSGAPSTLTAIDVVSMAKWQPSKEQFARWAQVKTSERSLPLIRECWADLVATEPGGGYFPLFDSAVVEAIIGRVVTNVLEIRTGKKRQGNGASLLITGVKGVGKTTVMKGLCRILGELEPKVTCVYHDYEDEKLPLVDLLRPHMNIVPGATFQEVLAKIGHEGRGLAMFLDEIQTLYVGQFIGNQPNPNYEPFVRIVRDIQKLGKTGAHAFGVISGSASNTRDRAYVQDELAKEGSYPNLNNGVYREYILRPIRIREEVEKAVRSIRGEAAEGEQDEEGSECEVGSDQEKGSKGDDDDDDDETLDAATIAKYFFRTGGVGRYLRAEVTKEYSGDRSVNFHRTMLDDVAFFALATRLSFLTPEPAFSAQDAFVVPSLTHLEVETIVKPRLPRGRKVSAAINEWVDGGFLYKTDDARYQFLVPADIDVYRKHANPNGDSGLFLNAALLGTLLGWGGHGSAGHVIEDYIRQRLLEDDQFDNWEAVSECEERPKRDEYLTNDMLAGIEPTKFAGRFFHQTKDCGLDGVFVGADPDDDNRVHLHALQIKSGGVKKKITPGGPRASEKKNDKTILGIIAKAQLGFERLFETLRSGPLPKKAPTKITFTLFTTKAVDDGAAKMLRKGFAVRFNGKRIGVECFLHSAKDTIDLLKPEHQLLLGYKPPATP